MANLTMNHTKIILIIIAFATLSGCKTTEPMYYYGAYNEAVYSYFKADQLTVSQQIEELENTLAKAGDRSVPPGLHAHLGMLYFEIGNDDVGLTHLLREKELFPESSHYINFLLSNKNVEGV